MAISVDEALRKVLDSVNPLGVERVPIRDATGRILAEDVRSPRDIPGFDNSAMDGYAVRAADVGEASEDRPARLAVLETIAAGGVPTINVGPGQSSRIMTGAPIPAGADAIVPVERTRGGHDTVEILAPAMPGAFVRPRGEDLREGDPVMTRGQRLRAGNIGTLASVSRSIIDVYRRPRVALVATGDELIDIDHVPTGAQVVNSSAYGLYAAITEAGGEAVILKIARDNEAEIRERLAEAATFDMALSTGGVSAGQFDYVQTVLDELGMRQLFHGVAQRPGRPLKYGLLEGRPFFGLPGNPVSTMVCFFLYVRPAILKMTGLRILGLPRVRVRCAVDISKASNLTEFVRVNLERREGIIEARPTGNQSSGAMSSIGRADALVIGPAALSMLPAGAEADALLLSYDAAADCEAFFEDRDRRQIL
jgi:molybdopterin molybdotransferase